MQPEKLTAEFMTALRYAGRDWHQVAGAIRALEYNIIREAQGEPWSAELIEYLRGRIQESLAQAQVKAVELEEYEWAHEIGVRLAEIEAGHFYEKNPWPGRK